MFEKEHLTVNEVAKWLDLNPQTIRKMLRDKEIFSIRVGNGTTARYRIPMQSILEWRNRHEDNT